MAIDKQSEVALLKGIQDDDFEPVRALLLSGLNINEKFTDGDSILHKCFALRKYNLSQHLILLGISIFSQDKFLRTPLHLSTRSGFHEGCNLITLLSPNFSNQDHKGRTALMHAIKYKQLLMVKILMGKGCDTDLKDNNGFTSLMWAVKFLNPKELRSMMEGGDEEKLQEQIQAAISEGKKVEISDEILGQASGEEDNESDSSADETVLPESLKEIIKDASLEADIASYSITGHIESLKKQAQEEGFSYKIALFDEDGDKSVVTDENSELNLETQTVTGDEAADSHVVTVSGTENNLKDEIQRVSSSQPNQISSDDVIVVSSSLQEEQEQENIQRISSSKATPNEILEDGKIARPELDVNTLDGGDKIERPVSGRPRELDNEVLRPQATDKKIEGDKEDLFKSSRWVGKGSTDKIESDNEVYALNTFENEVDELIAPLKAKTGAQTTKDPDKEIQEIKSLGANKEGAEEEATRSSLMDELDGSGDDKSVISKKNDISHISEGHSEVYKEDYGEIKTTDKKLQTDYDIGDIKKVDKSIGDSEYGEIKKTDKIVQADYEINQLDPEKFEHIESMKMEGKINRENDDFKLIEDIEKRSEQSDTHQSTENEIQMVKSVLSEQSPADDKMIVKSLENKSDSDESEKDSYTIKRKSYSEKEDENIQVIKGAEKEKEHSVVVKKSKQEEEEEEVKELLSTEKTIDVNEKNNKGQTLCWLASKKGQLDLLKHLIQQGAKLETKDPQGTSPLMIAAILGNDAVVEYLCHQVRNLDEKRSDGNTALTLAVEGDQSDVMRVLLDNGANSETKLKGSTLLMHAAAFDSIGCIEILIMLGHDPEVKNFRGKTAMDLAKANKHKSSYRMLKKIIKIRQIQAEDS